MTLCRKVGLEHVCQTKASLYKELDQHLGHLEHYSANFQGHLTEPCPACGKPCPTSPYPCPCQRPSLEPPIWPGQGKKNPSPSVVGPGINHVGRRRGKNVQTSMSLASLPNPLKVQLKQKHPLQAKRTCPPSCPQSPPGTAQEQNNHCQPCKKKEPGTPRNVLYSFPIVKSDVPGFRVVGTRINI